MVRVVADVGDSGGQVRLGPGPDDLPLMLMWPATGDGDRSRHGVAIVSLDDLGQLSLTYEGGAELSVDLIGYFTTDGAPVSTAGLFVPLPATVLFDGELPSGTANADLFAYNAEVGLPRSSTIVDRRPGGR